MANKTTYVFGADDKELKAAIEGLKANFGSLNASIKDTQDKLKQYLNKTTELQKLNDNIKQQALLVGKLKQELDEAKNSNQKDKEVIEQKNKAYKEQDVILKKLTATYRAEKRANQENIQTTKQRLALLKAEQKETIADAKAIDRETKELNKNTDAKNKSSKATGNLKNTIVRHLRQIETLIVAYYALSRGFQATIGKGIQVNRMMEDNTSGIAALLSANTRMVLSNGQAVDSYEKFKLGLIVAKETMDDLRKASVKTYATFPQLTEIFQQAIGQTLSMGDGFGKTTDEIIENTIKLSQRMSNIAGAIGMPMDRVREEIRSILSANASTDSLIATMIFGSPGEANKAIRNAKERGNRGATELLDAMLKPFDALEGVQSYTRTLLTFEDAWANTMRRIVEESGAFKDIQNIIGEFAKDLNENSDDIVGSFDSIYRGGKEFLDAAENFVVPAAVIGSIYALDVALVALATNPIVAGSLAIGAGLYSLTEWSNEFQAQKQKTERDINKQFAINITGKVDSSSTQQELLDAKDRVLGAIQKYSNYQIVDKVTETRTKLIGALAEQYNILEKRIDGTTAAEEKVAKRIKAAGELQTKFGINKAFLDKAQKETTKNLEKEVKLKAELAKIDQELNVLEKAKQDNTTNKEMAEVIKPAQKVLLDYRLAIEKQISEELEKRNKQQTSESVAYGKSVENIVKEYNAWEKQYNAINDEVEKFVYLEEVKYNVKQKNQNLDLTELAIKIKQKDLNKEETDFLLKKLRYVKQLRQQNTGVQKALNDYNRGLVVTNDILEDMTNIHLQSLQSGFTSFFDTQSDNFRDFGNLGKSILNDIQKQLVQQQLVKPLTAAVGSMTSNIFDMFLGFESGGFTSGGTKQIAGVVHGGEYVAPASQVKSNPALFSSLNASRGSSGVSGAMNIPGIKGFDDGGFSGGDGGEGQQGSNNVGGFGSYDDFSDWATGIGTYGTAGYHDAAAQSRAKAAGYSNTAEHEAALAKSAAVAARAAEVSRVEKGGLTMAQYESLSASNQQSYDEFSKSAAGDLLGTGETEKSTGFIGKVVGAVTGTLATIATANPWAGLLLGKGAEKLFSGTKAEQSAEKALADFREAISEYAGEIKGSLIGNFNVSTSNVEGALASYGLDGGEVGSETTATQVSNIIKKNILELSDAYKKDALVLTDRLYESIFGEIPTVTNQITKDWVKLIQSFNKQGSKALIETVLTRGGGALYGGAGETNLYPLWKDYAASINTDILSALEEEKATRRKISFIGGDKASLTSTYAQQDYQRTAAGLGIDITGLNAENFAERYKEAMKQSFTPETFKSWDILADSFNDATKAMEAYAKQFDVLFGTAQSIRASASSGTSNASTRYSDLYSKINMGLNNGGDVSRYLPDFASSAQDYASQIQQNAISMADYQFQTSALANQVEQLAQKGVSGKTINEEALDESKKNTIQLEELNNLMIESTASNKNQLITLRGILDVAIQQQEEGA